MCEPNNPAYKRIAKIGGQFDYGCPEATAADGSGEFVVPLPDNHTGPNFSRKHGSTADRSAPDFRGDFTWYGLHGLVSDGIREDDWGPIDPNNPSGPVLFYGATGDPANPNFYHGDRVSVSLLQVNVPDRSRFGVTPRTDGTCSWSSFRVRPGNVVRCPTPGMDCIPATFQNVKPGAFQISAEDSPRWHDCRAADVNQRHVRDCRSTIDLVLQLAGKHTNDAFTAGILTTAARASHLSPVEQRTQSGSAIQAHQPLPKRARGD